MSRKSERKSVGAVHESADRETQQIPLVPGPVGQVVESGSQPPGEQHTIVPQETVPMPIPAWPATPIIDEAPDKPPPLRNKHKESTRPIVDTSVHHTGLAQRTVLLTGELRRALPPWALPLLSSQPVSVWLGARIGLTVLAFLAGVMLPSIAPAGTANWYGNPGGPYLNPLVDHLGGVWTRWDGQWYLKIATEGYQKD